MNSRLVTVLHILAAARTLGEPAFGRTTIVKYTYLLEMLRPAYKLFSAQFRFVRYLYGPYSADVLTKANQLAFHGLAQVNFIQKSVEPRLTRSTYIATPEGIEASEAIASRTQASQELRDLAHDLVWGLQSLGLRKVQELCDLVYSEPSFVDVSRTASAKGIPTSEPVDLPSSQNPHHPSFRLQFVIQALLSRNEKPSTPRDILRHYLNILATEMHRPGPSNNW